LEGPLRDGIEDVCSEIVFEEIARHSREHYECTPNVCGGVIWPRDIERDSAVYSVNGVAREMVVVPSAHVRSNDLA